MAVAFTTEHTRTSGYQRNALNKKTILMIHFPLTIENRKPAHSFWYYVIKDLLAGAFGLLLLASLAYVIFA